MQELRSDAQPLRPGANTLRWRVPANGGMPLFRLGLELSAPSGAQTPLSGRVRLLSVDWDGAPHDFRQSGMLMSSIWNLRPHWMRAWVSAAREFAPDFELTYCISHSADNGLVTLGTRAWRDYAVETGLRFNLHRSGGLVLRSRGLRRYYAALFSGGDRLAIVARQDDAVHTLAQIAFPYEMERLYALRFAAVGDRLSLVVDGEPRLEARDDRYRSGRCRLRDRRGHHDRRRLPRPRDSRLRRAISQADSPSGRWLTYSKSAAAIRLDRESPVSFA